MKLIYRKGRIEIWACREPHGTDFWVYGIAADPRICPSEGMARELAAGAA